jgi:type 1 glutamine amidotransferase
VEPQHPSTAHLPAAWPWTDECYFFTNVNPGVRVLLALDPATLRDPKLASEPGQQVSGRHALAWCHEGDGGRRFYTSLGHKIEHYSDPQYRKHLRGALEWLLAKKHSP